MTPSVALAKILNRCKILSHFNFIVTVPFNSRTYKIPLLQKAGFSHLYMHRDYDYNVYDHFKNHIAQGIFLDIGASIGQTILKIKAINPDNAIVSVEPNPNCLYYLNDLKKCNQFQNLTIIPAAISDDSGLRKLFILNSFDTSASLITTYRENYFDPAHYIYVNTIRSEDLSQVLSQPISFIKIDVEGAELNVIRALRSTIIKDKPVIYCEVLDAHNEKMLPKKKELKQSIYSLVTADLNYQIFSFDVKSGQLIKLDGFPDRIYQASNLDACNYVFTPVS
jgi:FkbM family methyltransferase